MPSHAGDQPCVTAAGEPSVATDVHVHGGDDGGAAVVGAGADIADTAGGKAAAPDVLYL